MEKILITGSKGKIGRILVNGLKDSYDLTLADLPENDLRNYETVFKLASGNDAIIHLAWNTKKENYQSVRQNQDNTIMYENVYRAGLEARVPKIIMASSIHADNFQNHHGKHLMSSNKKPFPQNPYGKHKVEMEAFGKKYSKKGLEVVCIRFGAMGYGKPEDREGKAVWLSNEDSISLIKTILEAKRMPNNYLVMYGVSNNKSRIHDWRNPLGWKPKDDSSKI